MASAKGSFAGEGFVSVVSGFVSSTGSSLTSVFSALVSSVLILSSVFWSLLSSGVSSLTNTVLVSSDEVAGLAAASLLSFGVCSSMKQKI